MELKEPKKFDFEDFDLNPEDNLGEGGCATTYKARFKRNSVFCAVKKSHDRKNQKKIEQQTKKEIDILYNIKHRNIIGLFGIAYWSDKLCLVLEYASYGTVYDHLYHLKNTIDLTEEFKENTIRGVCSGLKHLHTGLSKPIRHGDIKSSNVLLCEVENGIVAKIADFGLSDELTSTKSGDGNCSHRWTAPEVIVPRDSDHEKTIKSIKSDIWSVGAFVWEIWTEKLPYSNTLPSDRALPYQIIARVGIQKLTPYNPDTDDNSIPKVYRSFLSNCFEFDHKKRWSITDVCEYLDSVPLASDSSEAEGMEYEESVRANSAIPIEIRNRYTKACFYFTNALEQDAGLFTTVKNLFRTEIPRGEMERIKSPHDLLDRLEQQELVSITDTSLLQTRLCIIGKEGERLANFFGSPMSPAEQPKAVEERKSEKTTFASADVSQALGGPLQRPSKDNDNALEKLMSDLINQKSQPGLEKVDRMLGRLQPKEDKPQ